MIVNMFSFFKWAYQSDAELGKSFFSSVVVTQAMTRMPTSRASLEAPSWHSGGCRRRAGRVVESRRAMEDPKTNGMFGALYVFPIVSATPITWDYIVIHRHHDAISTQSAANGRIASKGLL